MTRYSAPADTTGSLRNSRSAIGAFYLPLIAATVRLHRKAHHLSGSASYLSPCSRCSPKLSA
jgi:hypothetical protein